jgi:hypothetical protein
MRVNSSESGGGANGTNLPCTHNRLSLKKGKEDIFKRRNSNVQKAHEKMFTISDHRGNANQNDTKIPPHPC